MNPIFRIENNLGNTIFIPHQLVFSATGYLTKDTVVGTTVWSVEPTTQFTGASGRNVIIGVLGSPTSENLLATDSKTATTITAASYAGVYAHNRGDIVQQANFSAVSLESSPTASASGVWTVVQNITIMFNSKETIYQHSAGTAGLFYRIRLNDAGAFSAYSNSGVGIASTNFGNTTAGSLINSVRKSVGNADLPDDFFISAINDARRVVDTNYGFGRINEWRQVFEYPIQMLAGTNFVTLPTNIDFSETNRTLLAARFSRQSVAANIPITYCDKREWNQRAYLNRYSTTVDITSSGASSIVLTSTGDFGATGSISIATDGPTQLILNVPFTANNLSTNTLTITGAALTRNIPAGTQIWAYSTFSVPFFFTVFEDNLGVPKMWFDRPIPAGLQGKNIYLDYYKKISDIAFLADAIPEHYRDLYKDYLKFAIKRRRDDSIGEDDQDYIKFMRGIANILGNPYTGQNQIIIQ